MIGPAAKDAIPTLEKLTEHEDPQIAERAKAALRQVRGSESVVSNEDLREVRSDCGARSDSSPSWQS